jgi:hypothetical protein
MALETFSSLGWHIFMVHCSPAVSEFWPCEKLPMVEGPLAEGGRYSPSLWCPSLGRPSLVSLEKG